MDKDALAHRNRKLAEAFHNLPLKHHIRHALLRTTAFLPVPTQSFYSSRILLIRPDHLGDVLLSTPALRALRDARPYTEIHALVGPWAAPVLADFDAVDTVLTWSFPGFDRSDSTQDLLKPYLQMLRAARYLRQISYSSAIIMRPDHWWGAMLAFIAGIRERIGYDLPDVAPFLTHSIQHRDEHAVIQNLRLVERWTGKLDPAEVNLTMPIDIFDQDYIDDYLESRGIPRNRPLIGIHPGSGTWVKLWHVEKWATVADTLTEQLDAAVVFTGSPHEALLVQKIMSFMRHKATSAVGDTTVGQLAALYKRARVVLGPDSGPMHVATAAGAPTVTLFGPANPVEFGPWGPPEKHIVLTTDIGCRPCGVLDWADDNADYHPCVRDITIGQVLTAARAVAQHSDF